MNLIKAKAFEIFNEHMNLCLGMGSTASLDKIRKCAVQHSLIELEHILKTQLTYGEPDNETKYYDYWNGVKTEIEKIK